ncbi:hypothetical protein SISNIDRAFT_487913 [Sistotremastrum niveocremeum HHB9708]|uniref:MalT-like TPR region domain-containing protein n=1 Tax=Sistotremastrum niveocremeum HHB9708 TaxID=1314777 RepID=A0A164RUD8_9AGAM|nr:hypothetical protein SISNIDRAFT_487913 [Sistotremastrum niveocremeum HHB9708]
MSSVVNYVPILQDKRIPHLHGIWDLDGGKASSAQYHFLTVLSVLGRTNEGSTEFSASKSAIKAEALTQAARAMGLQSKFEEANEYLAQASQTLKELNEPMEIQTVRGRIALEEGRVIRFSGGRPSDAAVKFNAALTVLDGSSDLDYFVADALHMLALVAPTEEEKAEASNKALQIAEESANPRTRGWAWALLNNMAWDQVDAGKAELAVPLFKRAAEGRKNEYDLLVKDGESPAKEKALKAWRIGRWAYGHSLRLSGDAHAALEELKDLRASGHDGLYLREELAILLSARDDKKQTRQEASEHAKMALQLGLNESNFSGERVAEMRKIMIRGEN